MHNDIINESLIAREIDLHSILNFELNSIQILKTLKFILSTSHLALFFLYQHISLGQSEMKRVKKLGADFEFVMQLCNDSESRGCSNAPCLSMRIYSTNHDSLIDQIFICSDFDSLFSEQFLQIDDYNFDGHTDFRIRTKKTTTRIERAMGCTDFIHDYNYYMFDPLKNRFYLHLISSLRQVKIDRSKKMVVGTKYNDEDAPSNSETPTSYKYKLIGEGLKYCTIAPLTYPEPNKYFGNFAPTYRILDGRELRTISYADTLIAKPIVKNKNGFTFVKTRKIHPPNIDIENNPNIGYRSTYSIYRSSDGHLLTEIIGEYERIFDTHSDSIYAEDCNFDGFPDLAFKDEDKETYTSIYFFNTEKHSFCEYPFIKNLEKLSIDFKNKIITGKNTAQAFEITKYGQLRQPKKKVWKAYTFIGPTLRYVKVQTETFTPKRNSKVKTQYYTYNNNALTRIRKREFFRFSDSL